MIENKELNKSDYSKISVVVPVYNGEETIEVCVKSLLELNYPKELTELIIVNNNSNDSTIQILNKFNGQIEVINEYKKGPSAARNAGISNAKGDYIAFTDADCVVDRNWLTNIIKPLEREKVGIVGGKTCIMPGANYIEQFCEKIHNHEAALKRKRPRAVSLNWASRKDVLEKMGMFDEEFIRAQDTELSFRIFKAGYKFEYTPDAIVYHREAATLRELFYKGYLSGCYGIKFYKKHYNELKKLGHNRFSTKVYKRIGQKVFDLVKGKDVDNSKCFIIFQLGRIFGKIHGWIKFKHFEL